MTDRKEQIEYALIQAEKIASDPMEVNRAWFRLRRELRALSEPEAKPPKFKALLNAIWIAASNDPT